MTLEKQLSERCGSVCELCASANDLKIYFVPPDSKKRMEDSILVCGTCFEQLEHPDQMVANHWHCLNDSMWNQTPAVQVVVWRLLHKLNAEGWSRDLLDMLILEPETLAWAQTTGEGISHDQVIKHLDCNGAILESGDTVVVIKDLQVKGSSLVAKRGTAVRRISLVPDNPDQISGRVNDQEIVLLTKFVRKSK